MKLMPLLKHSKVIGHAVVDDSDYAELNKHDWHVSSQGYAMRRGPRPVSKCIFMHRVINNTPNGYETDHINGKRLDNRRGNLRSVTHAENNWNTSKYRNNTSGFKGLHKHRPTGLWAARIKINGRRFSLGYYKTKEKAAFAYRLAERIFRVLPKGKLVGGTANG